MTTHVVNQCTNDRHACGAAHVGNEASLAARVLELIGESKHAQHFFCRQRANLSIHFVQSATSAQTTRHGAHSDAWIIDRIHALSLASTLARGKANQLGQHEGFSTHCAGFAIHFAYFVGRSYFFSEIHLHIRIDDVPYSRTRSLAGSVL